MDNSTFRWILIIVGIVILVSIFLFGSPQRKRKTRASPRRNRMLRQRREPTLVAGDADSPADPSQTELGQGELRPWLASCPTARLLVQVRDDVRAHGLWPE